MEDSESLGVREAAQRLGCTTKYVYDLLYSRRLRGAQKVGKIWSIPVKAIEARTGAKYPAGRRDSE